MISFSRGLSQAVVEECLDVFPYMKSCSLSVYALPVAAHCFPNLTSLFVKGFGFVDHRHFAGVIRFKSLRCLDIECQLVTNTEIFKAFRSLDGLEELSIYVKSVTYEDCSQLVESVQSLKSLSLNIIGSFKNCSREGFAVLLNSLPKLESFNLLPSGVLRHVEYLGTLRSLSVCCSKDDDPLDIHRVGLNLTELIVIAYEPLDKHFLLTVLRHCQTLTSLEIESLSPNNMNLSFDVLFDCGHQFMNIVKLRIFLVRLTVERSNRMDKKYVGALCRVFPSVESLSIRYSTSLSDSADAQITEFICKNLKHLTWLLLQGPTYARSLNADQIFCVSKNMFQRIL